MRNGSSNGSSGGDGVVYLRGLRLRIPPLASRGFDDVRDVREERVAGRYVAVRRRTGVHDVRRSRTDTENGAGGG